MIGSIAYKVFIEYYINRNINLLLHYGKLCTIYWDYDELCTVQS